MSLQDERALEHNRLQSLVTSYPSYFLIGAEQPHMTRMLGGYTEEGFERA